MKPALHLPLLRTRHFWIQWMLVWFVFLDFWVLYCLSLIGIFRRFYQYGLAIDMLIDLHWRLPFLQLRIISLLLFLLARPWIIRLSRTLLRVPILGLDSMVAWSNGRHLSSHPLGDVWGYPRNRSPSTISIRQRRQSLFSSSFRELKSGSLAFSRVHCIDTGLLDSPGSLESSHFFSGRSLG